MRILRSGIQAFEDTSVHLSSSERRRIRRAIYRWQTYCNIFIGHRGSQSFNYVEDMNRNYRRADNASALFDIEQRRDLYFAYLNPWEFEEIVVIYDYVSARYSDILNGLEDDISTFSDSIVTKEFEEWIETFVAHGPDLLFQVLTKMHLPGAPRTWSEFVCEYQNGFHIGWMDNMMPVSSRLQARNPTGSNGNWNTRSRLYFEGDDVAEGPNAGWVIAHGGELMAR